MFTGIIEKKGIVLSNLHQNNANRLCLLAPFEELQIGESIAVNGVCLTLLSFTEGNLNFDLSPETLSRTTLKHLTSKDEVNLERAMLASTRFGGHYVSGHVDAIAEVNSIKNINGFIEIVLGGFEAKSMLYLIPKGSITVEGVSLTINEVLHQSIKLLLIPHTLLNTTFSSLKPGSKLNIEFDYLARVVAHQLEVSGKL